MKGIKNIIFDFDGTLVDTAPLIVATMHAAIDRLNLCQKTDDECKATIGIRLEDVPDIFWPGNELAKREFATTFRREFETLRKSVGAECYTGVLWTLEALHSDGYRMAIASSRSHKSLQEYVDEFDIADYFAMLIGGNDVEHGKPAADPVLKILNTCGWNAAETLTMGDAPVDIQMGKAAGTLTCAVTYGNGTEAELAAAGPDYIISDFPALAEIVEE